MGEGFLKFRPRKRGVFEKISRKKEVFENFNASVEVQK